VRRGIVLPRHQRIIIDLSLQVLSAAVARAADEAVGTTEVRLALRCLLPHCPERWPLPSFWEAGSSAEKFGRAEGCYAALNGIVLQLRAAGRYPE